MSIVEATRGAWLNAPPRRGLFRFTGPLSDLSGDDRRSLFARGHDVDEAVAADARAIVESVRARGDAALFDVARAYDDVRLDRLEVPSQLLDAATANLPTAVRSALMRAIRNVRCAHEAWRPRAVRVEVEPGVVLERRPEPLARVGVYAPGGRAVYPSSVIMGVVPARVAGVDEVILCSPPDRSGAPPTLVLAAARLAGVDRVFAVGGAGAIAAFAYGTETIPRVDRIVGPGNAYVTAAKQAVATAVGTDTPAGPSELLVITDASPRPDAIAREVLAQAEHDPRAAVVVLTTSAPMTHAISNAVDTLLPIERRREIIAAALATRGAVLLVSTLEEAVAFSNAWAPEHLWIAVANPRALAGRVRSAGSVFLGASSSVTFGDYLTGANHVLPTEGVGRYRSGLSTEDFVRWTTYQEISPAAARSLSGDVATLASSEGLPAHAAAARYQELAQ